MTITNFSEILSLKTKKARFYALPSNKSEFSYLYFSNNALVNLIPSSSESLSPSNSIPTYPL